MWKQIISLDLVNGSFCIVVVSGWMNGRIIRFFISLNSRLFSVIWCVVVFVVLLLSIVSSFDFRLVLIIRYSVIGKEIVFVVVSVVVNSIVVRLEQLMIVNMVLIKVFSMILLVSEVKIICILFVWVMGCMVWIISLRVNRISFRLIFICLSCLVWVCLWLRKKIILININNGDSYDRLKVNIFVISVVLMLVFSIIISVGIRFIKFWVINEVISMVVVLLFCISVVMLRFVQKVSGFFFMLLLRMVCR